MRVIAGTLGGRQFDSPSGHRTHPMSDRARGALFNILGDIAGLHVLDAFAGSGALSFEAVSRGAASAVAIDVDKSAHETLLKNVQKLDLEDEVEVVRANAGGWSANNPQRKFDLILLDPPYDGLRPALLQNLADNHLAQDGTLVLSCPADQPEMPLSGLKLLDSRVYAGARLVFYKKEGSVTL